MALEVLLQALADDGAAEARQIVDAARAEADAIRAGADARVERRTADAYAARETELRSLLDARRARARNEARVQVLLARARFMDQVFCAAEAALPGILDHAPDALEHLCREALEFFPAGGARIRCRTALARMIVPSVSGGAPVSVDDGVPEGVIVESVDGQSRIDNTLEARLRRRRPELSIMISSLASEGT